MLTALAIERQPRWTFGEVCMILRAAIVGKTTSPPIFEVMEILGREECLARMRAASR